MRVNPLQRSDKSMQFPAGLSCRLRDLETLARGVLLARIPENPLHLEREAIALVVGVVRQDGHNGLEAILGVYGLFPHQHVRVTGIGRTLSFLQLLSFFRRTETRLWRAIRTALTPGHRFLLQQIWARGSDARFVETPAPRSERARIRAGDASASSGPEALP